MMRKVLLVDDEVNALASHFRVLHHRFEMDLASGGEEALKLLGDKGPYAVLVADMQMPGMNGVELLQKAQELHPDVIRVMLTGNLDQRTAIGAINKGQVFRFLTKPCSADELGATLEAGIRQFQLEAAEKELLEKTLTGALKVLTEILAISDSEAFGRAEVLADRAVQVARHLGRKDTWEIDVAARLSPLGLVTLPPGLAEKERAWAQLTPQERTTLQRVPEFGADLLARIPRLEGVALTVRYQKKNFGDGGYPLEGPQGEDLPLGSRILRALSDFVEIERRRGSRIIALEQLKLKRGLYDPRVLDAIETLFIGPLAPEAGEVGEVSPMELRPGMILRQDVKTHLGLLLAEHGTELHLTHIEKIRNFAALVGIQTPIRVQRQESHGGES